MKKIMLVLNSLDLGGAERIVSILSESLCRLYDVKVVTFYEPTNYVVGGEHIKLKFKKEEVFIRRIFLFIKKIIKLRMIIEKEKPDIVISFVANLPVILTGKKVFVSIHNNPNFYSRFNRIIMKTLYKSPNVQGIITVSEGLRNVLKNQFYYSSLKMIYNPIDDNLIDKSILINNVEDIPKEFFVAVGSLTVQKNHIDMIKAFINSEINKAVKLLIIGDGEQREALETYIKVNFLEERIILLGKKKNPFIYMKNAIAMVLSSTYEGFGMVITESLYTGTPVISYNCDFGPNEIIINNYNGILIEAGDSEELSKAINRIYIDREFRNFLALNTSSSVKKFQVSNIIKEWIEFIEEYTE